MMLAAFGFAAVMARYSQALIAMKELAHAARAWWHMGCRLWLCRYSCAGIS